IASKGKNIYSADNTNTADGNFLPSYNSTMMGYTRTGKNIVVILLDMMTGGYVPRLIEEIPEVIEKYKGFVWYPNTLTIGNNTATSMSSMYGGWSYSPIEINKNNTKKTLIEIITESYEVLPNLLKEKKYVTSYTNPENYITPRGDVDLLNKKGIIAGFNRDYIPYWIYRNRENKEHDFGNSDNVTVRLLTMVSIFKASPFLLKPIIYDNGDWLIIGKDEIKNKGYKWALEHWAFLDLMKDVSNADENNNTFKYFHNFVTHFPYAMSKEGILIKDEYPDPSAGNNMHGDNAYFSYKAAFEAISRWIEWLKKEGIYDNTMIILVSDHGASDIKNPMMPIDFKFNESNDKYLQSSQVLLMVKKFHSNEDLKIDWRFMSNADVPALICSAAGIDNKDIGKDPTIGDSWENRVLDTVTSSAWRWEQLQSRTKFDIYWHYRVKNNLFDDKNWEKVE
ncbi:MAG: sulfatase-like hydrolase/transferase, partial [Spirochaetaceae bacterium]|nr:sulfatase-like hydrolase/transferase [Spirochaetaceae bacterium]